MTALGLSIVQMPGYQHVVVVMSIVLGLTITQLLKGIAQLYRARARVRTYWIHWGWVGLLLVFSLLLWWTFWNYREISEWSFFRFVLYLSPVVTLFYLTAIVIPDPSDTVTSLRDYYFANRVALFGTFAVCGVLAGVTAALVRGLPWSDPSHLFRLVLVLLMLIAMRSANERVHAAILFLSASMMLLFIFLYHFRLN
jgi:hypothetical protein